jgi:hypothetical protein
MGNLISKLVRIANLLDNNCKYVEADTVSDVLVRLGQVPQYIKPLIPTNPSTIPPGQPLVKKPTDYSVAPPEGVVKPMTPGAPPVTPGTVVALQPTITPMTNGPVLNPFAKPNTPGAPTTETIAAEEYARNMEIPESIKNLPTSNKFAPAYLEGQVYKGDGGTNDSMWDKVISARDFYDNKVKELVSAGWKLQDIQKEVINWMSPKGNNKGNSREFTEGYYRRLPALFNKYAPAVTKSPVTLPPTTVAKPPVQPNTLGFNTFTNTLTGVQYKNRGEGKINEDAMEREVFNKINLGYDKRLVEERLNDMQNQGVNFSSEFVNNMLSKYGIDINRNLDLLNKIRAAKEKANSKWAS